MNKKIWVGFYLASFLLFLLAALIVGFVLLLQMDSVMRFSEQALTRRRSDCLQFRDPGKNVGRDSGWRNADQRWQGDRIFVYSVF
jgi:hypothetical protein